jgi:PAS domain S-box-containing protein
MWHEPSRLVDLLPGLIWIAGADASIEFLNATWSEYSGLSIAELSQGFHTVVHPQDMRMVQERWPLMVACEGVFEMEVRLRRLDGEYRWFVVRSRRLPDGPGGAVRLTGINTDIDDRKRSEQALRTLQSNLREMCESIPGLVCTMSPTGEVEVFNRELLEYFGRTAEEMKGWATSDAVHADDRARVLEAFTKAVSSGTPYDVEHRCRRFDGMYRWFQVRALPMRDANRATGGWFVLLTDIEDRRQAEEVIRASERNLNLIINTIPALAWSATPDGLAEFLNQHYLEYLGVNEQQARGNGWAAAVHPDDIEQLTTTWVRIMSSGRAGEAEARLRRSDGVYRWFLFRANPLHDGAGRIVKWYGTNTDIDDRKRAEEQLRRSETLLAEGQRLGLTGSWAFDPDTEELTFSEQARRIYEFDDDDAPLTLTRLYARAHPDDLSLVRERTNLARAGVSDLDIEFRLLMPSGALKYVRSNSYYSRKHDGRLELVGAIQDITERRRSEEALSQVRSELAHMTRVASLGALTASIAHEVNQPLAGIVTNANTCLRMLASEPPNVEGARETARRTLRDSHRASEVITRLRALFSKKSMATEQVDLNEATREVLALSRAELQRGRVVVRAELADELPLVLGDRVQLQQVILNLLLNASAAMSEVDGRVRELSIKTEREQEQRVRLTVRDAGVGLDTQTIERLFEAFYTTKSNGMGLGLSVSRSIIESHRGRLSAAPNDGPGATFWFSIPCADRFRLTTGSSG